MNWKFNTVLFSLFTSLLFAKSGNLPDASKIEIMPAALETELALSAAPEHLQAGAGVYLLKKNGYVKVKESSNGFNCLVGRPEFGVQESAYESIAYDAEASRTVLQAVLDNAKFRAKGYDSAKLEQMIRDGYKTGKYSHPERTSIVYMQSAFLKLSINGKGGTFANNHGTFMFHPHNMIMAPNTTYAELGLKTFREADRKPWNPVITAENSPVSYIVFMLGEKEMMQIREEQKSLIEKMQKYLESR